MEAMTKWVVTESENELIVNIACKLRSKDLEELFFLQSVNGEMYGDTLQILNYIRSKADTRAQMFFELEGIMDFIGRV